MHTKSKKFIITGGGTGGHVFSAIATADEIKKRLPDAEILFVGAKNYLEESAVPKAGYSIKLMTIHRIKRHQKWKNIKHLFQLPVSLFKSYRILKKFKPDAAIGTGGFATGPVLFVAQWLKIPTFIQDHNSYPGLTTQLLAKKATRIHTAYEEINQYLDSSKILLTGNPVRSRLFENLPEKTESVSKFGLKDNLPVVLILGGSGGAEPVNQAIARLIPKFKNNQIQVIWQTGKDFFNKYKSFNDDTIKVLPFIDDIQYAYGAADIIITRSGAMSISELSLIGKPPVLIPDHRLEQDHQTKNAQALANKNAAVYIHEKDLSSQLFSELQNLIANPEKYNEMVQNLKQFAFPEATKKIVDDIFETLKTL